MSIRDLPVAALDINNKYTVSLCCKQNDDIILNLSIFDKSVQADLSDYTVRLKAFKSDQIPLIQDSKIRVTNNNIRIECSNQLTTTPCIVKAELQFVEKDTLKKKTTFFIEIEVGASALGGDGTVSTPTCTLLEEIDNKLDEIENIGQVLDEAKKVRDTLENDISTGNTTHTNIQQSITDANNKKIEVEIAISNANSKITEVDESITNADQSKAELDNSKELADQSKTELDSANTQAAENIAALEALGDVTELAKNVQTNTNNINTLQENVASNTSQLNDIANEVNQLSNPNLLINGDFQVWQRGTSFDKSNSIHVYTADRWLKGSNTGEVTKSGNKLKFKGTADAWNLIRQYIENFSSLSNRTVTLSAKVNFITNCNKIDLVWFNGIDWQHKSFNNKTSSTSEILTFTFTPNLSGKTKFAIGILIYKTNEEVEIEWAKLEIGSVATPFVPRSYGEELALCQRYYEVTAIDDMFVGVREPNGNYLTVYNFKVEKRVSPTVTVGHNIYGDGKMYLLSRHTGTKVEVTPVNMSATQVRLSSPTREDDSVNSCSFCGWIRAEAEIY